MLDMIAPLGKMSVIVTVSKRATPKTLSGQTLI